MAHKDKYLHRNSKIKTVLIIFAVQLSNKIQSTRMNMTSPNDMPTNNIEETEAVSAKFVTISECLKLNLQIPEYQRPYRWQERNVEQLLNDTHTNMSNNKAVYLIGSVILHKEGKVYNIVDGQQRVTTISLLLKYLENTNYANSLKFRHKDSYYHIKANYEYIKQWCDRNIADKVAFAKYIKESCRFVLITVKNLSEAFQMFESQNGRGKELEAYNLLKAYHIRAMTSSPSQEKIQCDQRWEAATMCATPKYEHDDLLKQLFNEQLYRTRMWSKGGSAYRFSKKVIDEFKGLTIDKNQPVEFAYQNTLLQQVVASIMMSQFHLSEYKVKSRFQQGDAENINPFVHINQLLINGRNFFDYIETYVELYKRLFVQLDTEQLRSFKHFYNDYCLRYRGSYRQGDKYIREVYKSAILLLFDRFGEKGLDAYHQDIYICLYKYRLEQKQVKYDTMAKKENVAWIFQMIQNAKSLSDLSPIQRHTYEIKKNLRHVFEVPTNIKKLFQTEQP